MSDKIEKTEEKEEVAVTKSTLDIIKEMTAKIKDAIKAATAEVKAEVKAEVAEDMEDIDKETETDQANDDDAIVIATEAKKAKATDDAKKTEEIKK